MRIAALGCSHTCGYHVGDLPDNEQDWNLETWPFSGKWNDNNWAEYYINNKGADGVIFANPSNGWWEYSEWLSFLFKKYDDIKEVVVQNTYWNRFRLSMHYPQHYEKMIPLDELYELEHKKGNIDLWIKRIHNKEQDVFDIPMQAYPVDFQNNCKFTVKFDPRFMMGDPDLRSVPYMTVKTWMELMSLKAQREFAKELYIMQELCRNNGASFKVFALNKWTFIPENLNDFFKFDLMEVAKQDVESWFLQNLDTNIGTKTIDDEHYNKEVHEIIASKYLPSQFGKEQ